MSLPDDHGGFQQHLRAAGGAEMDRLHSVRLLPTHRGGEGWMTMTGVYVRDILLLATTRTYLSALEYSLGWWLPLLLWLFSRHCWSSQECTAAFLSYGSIKDLFYTRVTGSCNHMPAKERVDQHLCHKVEAYPRNLNSGGRSLSRQ